LKKDLIIIWKFFSDKPTSKKIKITEGHLKKFDKKNADRVVQIGCLLDITLPVQIGSMFFKYYQIYLNQ
jgi:hypothetical protein